jgi:hypothetical protein
MGLAIAKVVGRAVASFLVLLGGFAVASPRAAAQQRDAEAGRVAAEGARERAGEERPSVNDTQRSDALNKERSLKRMEQDFLFDQKRIWTSPAHLRLSDAQWLVPVSGIAAGLFVTDRDFSTHLSHDPKRISHYKNLSNAGIGALIGGAGGMWLLGHVRHNEHWSETGFLSGEAALNSLVLVESMKYSLRRERPFQGDGSGPFFHGGTSFPSEHAAAAWAVAGVIAHEYPGVLSKILAYGAASAVSYSRVRGRQHFPSDVFIGGLVGNLIAQDIYSHHHDSELPGAIWRPTREFFGGDGNSSPANHGSPYVPLDSWIYPAFERLAALGYVNSGMLGMRPWTRLECARLLGEAQDQAAGNDAASSEAEKIFDALGREFSFETDSSGEETIGNCMSSPYMRALQGSPGSL